MRVIESLPHTKQCLYCIPWKHTPFPSQCQLQSQRIHHFSVPLHQSLRLAVQYVVIKKQMPQASKLNDVKIYSNGGFLLWRSWSCGCCCCCFFLEQVGSLPSGLPSMGARAKMQDGSRTMSIIIIKSLALSHSSSSKAASAGSGSSIIIPINSSCCNNKLLPFFFFGYCLCDDHFLPLPQYGCCMQAALSSSPPL